MGYVIEPRDIWIARDGGDGLALSAEQRERIDKALAEFWEVQQLLSAAGDAALDKLRADIKRQKLRAARRK